MKKLTCIILISIFVLISACDTVKIARNEDIIVAFRADIRESNLVYIEPEIGIIKKVRLPRDNMGIFYSSKKQLWVYASGGSLFLFDDQKNQETELYNTSPMPSSPVWSPDGKQIAFSRIYETAADLNIYNVDEKTATNLVKNTDFYMFPKDWSKDNSHILLRSGYLSESNENGNFVSTISADGKNINTIFNLPVPSSVVDLQYSPDEKFIVMEIRNPNKIALFDIKNNKEVDLPNIPKESTSPVWSPDGKEIAFIHDKGIYTYLIKSGEITQIQVPQDFYVTLFWIEEP